MPLTTQEFMKRALITSDELAAAGMLNPIQADRFIDFVFDLSALKGIVRQERFTRNEMDIDKIALGDRVMVPAEEGVDPGIRVGVSHSKVVLQPRDMMVPFEISDRYRRTNLEQDKVEDHIVEMMATQTSNNTDLAWLDSNTVGPAIVESDYPGGGSTTDFRLDSTHSLFDGLLKIAEGGNVVDAGNAALSGTVFNKALLAMPVKYRRDRRLLKYLISPDHEQGYRQVVSQRSTPAGDNALQSQMNLTPFGVELVPVPMLERNPFYTENSVANTDGTTATALSHRPISELTLHNTTLGKVPETPFVLATDYNQDLTLGTWTRLGGGVIGSGATVKATYRTRGKMILTDPSNIVTAMQSDNIRIEKQRNMYKGMDEFVITVSIDVKIINLAALVLVTNIADPTL